MLGWDPYRSYKKRARTHYTELVFLYLVGFAGQVMHSGACEARNIDVLFFILKWALCGYHKKHAGTRYDEYVFLHPVGSCGSRSAFWCVRGTKL
jgi:hypothetical protein